MLPFEELVKYSSDLHGHRCAGQILGVRMAMVGCGAVGIDEPRGSKKLLVYVEIDRCATDAIQAVTGCSLGKRTLKFLDYGKMAATFLNLESGKAVRVLAKDESRFAASFYAPQGCSDEHDIQKKAYMAMPDEALFETESVSLHVPPQDMPGARGGRQTCSRCGEGINFGREIREEGKIFCLPCGEKSRPVRNRSQDSPRSLPKVVLVVGSKKTGKTTLIECLVPELSARGHRVGTLKHHHTRSPLDVDRPGKDSWRHRQAGAKSVALVSPAEIVVFQDTEKQTPFQCAIQSLNGVDLVLAEGFSSEREPRIEVSKGPPPAKPEKQDPSLLARIGSELSDGGVLRYAKDEILALADLIEERILGKGGASRRRSVIAI
jgi:formylmethanofuran dehydrogenase subunit E